MSMILSKMWHAPFSRYVYRLEVDIYSLEDAIKLKEELERIYKEMESKEEVKCLS